MARRSERYSGTAKDVITQKLREVARAELASSSSESDPSEYEAPTTIRTPKPRPPSRTKQSSGTGSGDPLRDALFPTNGPVPVVENSDRFKKIRNAAKRQGFTMMGPTANSTTQVRDTVLLMHELVKEDHPAESWVHAWGKSLVPNTDHAQHNDQADATTSLVDLINVVVLESAGFPAGLLDRELLDRGSIEESIRELSDHLIRRAIGEIKCYPIWCGRKLWQTFSVDLTVTLTQLMVGLDATTLLDTFVPRMFEWLHPLSVNKIRSIRHSGVMISGILIRALYVIKEQWKVDVQHMQKILEDSRGASVPTRQGIKSACDLIVKAEWLLVNICGQIMSRACRDMLPRIQLEAYMSLCVTVASSSNAIGLHDLGSDFPTTLEETACLYLWSIDRGLPEATKPSVLDPSLTSLNTYEVFKTLASGVASEFETIGIVTLQTLVILMTEHPEWLMEGNLREPFHKGLLKVLLDLCTYLPDNDPAGLNARRATLATEVLCTVASINVDAIPARMIIKLLDGLVYNRDETLIDVHSGLLDSVIFSKPLTRAVGYTDLHSNAHRYRPPPPFELLNTSEDDAADLLDIDAIVEFLMEYTGERRDDNVRSAFLFAFWRRSPALRRVDLMVNRLCQFNREVQERREGRSATDDIMRSSRIRRNLLLNMIQCSISFLRRDVVYEMLNSKTSPPGSMSLDQSFGSWANENNSSNMIKQHPGLIGSGIMTSYQTAQMQRSDVINLFNQVSFEDPFLSYPEAGSDGAPLIEPFMREAWTESLKKMSLLYSSIETPDELRFQHKFISSVNRSMNLSNQTTNAAKTADESRATALSQYLTWLNSGCLAIWKELATENFFKRALADGPEMAGTYFAVLCAALDGLGFQLVQGDSSVTSLISLFIQFCPLLSIALLEVTSYQPQRLASCAMLIVKMQSTIKLCTGDNLDHIGGALQEKWRDLQTASSQAWRGFFESCYRPMVNHVDAIEADPDMDPSLEVYGDHLQGMKDGAVKLACCLHYMDEFPVDIRLIPLWFELVLEHRLYILKFLAKSKDEHNQTMYQRGRERVDQLLDVPYIGSLLNLTCSAYLNQWSKILNLSKQVIELIALYITELYTRDALPNTDIEEADTGGEGDPLTKRRKLNKDVDPQMVGEVPSVDRLGRIMQLLDDFRTVVDRTYIIRNCLKPVHDEEDDEIETKPFFKLMELELQDKNLMMCQLYVETLFQLLSRDQMAVHFCRQFRSYELLPDDRILSAMEGSLLSTKETNDLVQIRHKVDNISEKFKQFFVSSDPGTYDAEDFQEVGRAIDKITTESIRAFQAHPFAKRGIKASQVVEMYAKAQPTTSSSVVPIWEVSIARPVLLKQADGTPLNEEDTYRVAFSNVASTYRILTSSAACHHPALWSGEMGTVLFSMIKVPGTFSTMPIKSLRTLFLSNVVDQFGWYGCLASITLPIIFRNALDQGDVIELVANLFTRSNSNFNQVNDLEMTRPEDCIKFAEECLSILSCQLPPERDIGDYVEELLTNGLGIIAKSVCLKAICEAKGWDDGRVSHLYEEVSILSTRSNDPESVNAAIDGFLNLCVRKHH